MRADIRCTSTCMWLSSLSTLYIHVGDLTISDITLEDSANNEFTLTCISTGGPATTVTWTRDSETAVGTQRSAVVNGVTAQYTHTLTVTGRLGGLYTCTVANNKPSSDRYMCFNCVCVRMRLFTQTPNLPLM